MEFARFGATGMRVSRLCLGRMANGSTWRRDKMLDVVASRSFIREASDKRINFFETVDVCSTGLTEEILGRALKDFTNPLDVVILTKALGETGKVVNTRGHCRKHILEAIDGSLKRMGTDCVDLYQPGRFDPVDAP